MFFCPFNLFYKLVSFLPIKLVLVAMKEVVRVRKIAIGIHHAHHHYHHGWLVMVLIGWVKGKPINIKALIKTNIILISKLKWHMYWYNCQYLCYAISHWVISITIPNVKMSHRL